MRTYRDPLFTAVEAGGFSEQHIASLVAGTAAAVRVPGFLDQQTCVEVMGALGGLPVGEYDPARVPNRVVRFGPALNDFRTADGGLDAGRYWPAATAAKLAWERARLRPDPVAVALGKLGTAWGSAVTPATIDGREVFGGTVREINDGALIHCDEVVRELPHGFDQAVVAQLAFNLWVAAPESGGQTVIWRRRWQPEDDARRDAYGYRSTTVEGCQHVSLRPQVGDALLFNPVHLHAVNPCKGRRVAFAFFLGLTTTGRLVVWS
ncbi:2OG-Fe(II)-dependent halogenase WelO5 family protein [Actinokineospora sp. NPDC004072]